MNEKSTILLRLLLNRYHGGKMEPLLKILPEEESQKILNVPIESGDADAILAQVHQGIENIHYSWLIPSLEKVEKRKLPFILSLLPETHAGKLRKYFKDQSEPLKLSRPMKAFLFSQFHEAFKLDDVLPLAFLPETDMTPLSKLKKNELIDLIDFLGLFDLAEEIHHIVDKHLLEQIYSALSKRKLLFLKKCLHQKEKLITQRLQLEGWDGEASKLSKLLHHKGIIRLGYALSGENRDFIWHITHILDTGRGEKLSRYCNKDPIPGVTGTLKKQVKSILNYFKQASEK